MNTEDAFGEQYVQARSTFIEAARAAGATLQAHAHPLSGPKGESLSMDVARLGAPGAEAVLVLSSGTHGVEGICGSGVQIELLRAGLAGRIPQGVAVVLVHAVNPFGFAWLRRVNEDNVDINRNFVDHAAGDYPANPLYDEIDAALNPTAYGRADVAGCLAQIGQFMASHTPAEAYRGLSGGQYTHPRGLHYGGREPAWSNRTIRAVWAEHVGEAKRAALVDLHSGLGIEGEGVIMQTAASESTAAQLAEAWWSRVLLADPATGEDEALISGLMGPAFVDAFPGVACTGVVLEFGTRDPQTVLMATHADNWLHHYGEPDSEAGRAIKQRMRDAFYIDTDGWREQLSARVTEVVDQALAGLAEGHGGR